MKGSRSMRECDKFLSKIPSIRDDSVCWIWQGTDNGRGYGVFSHNQKNVSAHRYSYEFFIGPIPSGLVIDHLCVNTRCVNPHHMEPVTNAENISRQGRRKTVCKRGHPLTPGNYYIDKYGCRGCKECKKIHTARYLLKHHRTHWPSTLRLAAEYDILTRRAEEGK